MEITWGIYFAVCMLGIYPLLLFMTKLHDKAVDVADLVVCLIISVVPIVNLIAIGFLFFMVMGRNKYWRTVVF